MTGLPKTVVHDVSEFPLVHLRTTAICPGYGPTWCADMDRLLEAGSRFVLIYPPIAVDETMEDRRCRCEWLRGARRACGDACMALIAVEPDAERRAALEGVLPGVARAFGTTHAIAASMAEADALGRGLLTGGARG